MRALPTALVFCLLVFLGDADSVGAHAREVKARLDSVAKQLTITAADVAGAGWELRVETPGLREIETGRDVNEPGIIYLPPRKGLAAENEPSNTNAENIFFFNDLVRAEGWDLVVLLPDGLSGTWKLNGRFSPLGGTLQPEIAIGAGDLEVGENLLHLRGDSVGGTRPRLYFRRRLAVSERGPWSLEVARPDWSGDIGLFRAVTDGRDSESTIVLVRGPELSRTIHSIPDEWWKDTRLVQDAALAVGRNALAAQVVNPRSFFSGGFNLVYDTKRKSRRMPHWIWSWGPVITLLLDLEQMPAARDAGMAKRFRTAALAAADRSLAFEVTDFAHPAAGVSTVRWESSRAVPNGWVEYISTADSLFLAGWGWMSAYQASRKSVFLERTRSLVTAAERLMNEYPLVPQDWVVERERWTPHTLDESVFGMIGFRELHRVAPSNRVAAQGKRFLDSHLEKMSREDGLLERAWSREENRPFWGPDIKGHAWVVEGYLDAYSLTKDSRYLELARTLAARVLACQRADGSWSYQFKPPTEPAPPDDKGTAIWAFMLYELHRYTGSPEHLSAARRAAGWCLRHQYRGEDPHLDGGILSENQMSYVRRRPMTILYSTTFLGLALLEELKLAGNADTVRR